MNKTHPTLFSRDSLGNVRIWSIEVQGDKFRTTSGLQNGQLVVSEWTLALPKNEGRSNETTGEEQATAEVEAKYKKQLKTGYHKDLKDIDKVQYVECMLAKKWRDYEDKIDLTKKEWLLQIKFNGNRCIATASGLFTRKGERYVSCPHIEESLEPFFVKYPDAVLDSELFNYDFRQQLNEISKLIRRTVHITPEDLKRSRDLVKIYVYDGYSLGEDSKILDENAPYEARKAWIDANLIGKYPYIEKVDSIVIESKEQLAAEYQKFIEDNQEGGMLRLRNGKYEHKRAKSLLKIKEEDDEEGIIENISTGTGNWANTGKVITLKWNNKIFDATFKGNHEQATEFLKNKDQWIGKTVKFLYNGLTGKLVPNYARVDINNCSPLK